MKFKKGETILLVPCIDKNCRSRGNYDQPRLVIYHGSDKDSILSKHYISFLGEDSKRFACDHELREPSPLERALCDI